MLHVLRAWFKLHEPHDVDLVLRLKLVLSSEPLLPLLGPAEPSFETQERSDYARSEIIDRRAKILLPRYLTVACPVSSDRSDPRLTSHQLRSSLTLAK